MSDVSEMKAYKAKWQKSVSRFFERSTMEIMNDLSIFALICLFPFLLFYLLSSGDDESELSNKQVNLSYAAQKTLINNGNVPSSIIDVFIELYEHGIFQMKDNGILIVRNNDQIQNLSSGAVALLFLLGNSMFFFLFIYFYIN
jgi:hypothetical protein